MDDKELLEKAANANWKEEIADEEVSLRYDEREEAILYFHADNQDHNGCDREFGWNPLTDDGDALRLAVKLDIPVSPESVNGTIWICKGDLQVSEPMGSDPYAATRRAIVRAAAAIAE